MPPSHANCCYRFLVPAATLQEDPKTRWWNDDADGRLLLYPDNSTNRRLVSYPCRGYVRRAPSKQREEREDETN